MRVAVNRSEKVQLAHKLVEIWSALEEIEKINLLAAIRCLGCRHFEACETSQSNLQSLEKILPRPR